MMPELRMKLRSFQLPQTARSETAAPRQNQLDAETKCLGGGLSDDSTRTVDGFTFNLVKNCS